MILWIVIWNCNWNRQLVSDMSMERGLSTPASIKRERSTEDMSIWVCNLYGLYGVHEAYWCLLVLHGSTIWSSIVIERKGLGICEVVVWTLCKFVPSVRDRESRNVPWMSLVYRDVLCSLDESRVTLDCLLKVRNNESCGVVLMYHFVHVWYEFLFMVLISAAERGQCWRRVQMSSRFCLFCFLTEPDEGMTHVLN